MKKNFQISIILICLVTSTSFVMAQDPREGEIRRLEPLERESVLKGDSAALFDKIC